MDQTTTITQIRLHRKKIVCSTAGNGLYELNEDSLRQSKWNNDLADLYINDIELDGLGRLWIATDHGVHVVDSIDQKHVIAADRGLGDNIVTQLNRNGDQMLIGTQRAGLYKSNMLLHVEPLYNPNDEWIFGSIRDIVSIDQRIWASTDGYGIIELADVSEPYFRHYTDSTNLLNTQTSDLMLDREGSIWVTFNQGPTFNPLIFSLNSSRITKAMTGII